MAKKRLEDLRPTQKIGGASNEDENHRDVKEKPGGLVALLIYGISGDFKKEEKEAGDG